MIGVIGLDLRASYLELLLKEIFPACGNSSYVYVIITQYVNEIINTNTGFCCTTEPKLK